MNRSVALSIVAPLALLFTACPSAPPKDGASPTTTVAMSAEPKASASVPTPVATFEEGTYASPHCGGRGYAREVTFDARGFTAVDLVSPCPAGTNCIWSGIVERTGTYVVSGTKVDLTITSEGRGPGVVDFPKSFVLADKAIVETSDAGSCVYSKK